MKKATLTTLLVAAAGILTWAFYPAEIEAPVEELEIGSKAPMTDVEVKDVSGEMLTLQGVAKENGLLVIFSCNTCPWVRAWEDRYNPIASLAEENNVGLIMLNPNTTARDRGDGFEDMKQRAQEENYQFYYALDENNKIADAFGATRTPHVYLFNSSNELVYRGAIDDNAKSAGNVEEHYLKDAINQLAAGEEISTKTTKSLGCTIKRAR